MTDPLTYHILARLTTPPESTSGPAPDQKAKFGRYENQQAGFAHSRDLPELALENLPDVVRREFALSPPAVGDERNPVSKSAYRDFWLDHVEREPWDIYSIAEDMAARFDINEGWAFKTARQHLNQLVLQARMRGYREERLAGRRFDWSGPEPDHPACEWLMEQVPEEGLPFHELVELMGEAKQRFVENPPATPHVVHEWCRHEITEER